MRSARVDLLYPCRYAREKLSVRESDRRCYPLAFCPKRISVGRAYHHRKRMHSNSPVSRKTDISKKHVVWLYILRIVMLLLFSAKLGGVPLA